MSKHAMPRSRRLGQLKPAATAALVLAFVTLFVGGATGMIGSRDDGGGGDLAADVGAASDQPGPADAVVDGEGDGTDDATTPDDEPTEIVTDVPPQDVKDAKKLKRSLAWLRRGLADETTFRVGTFNVLGSSHTAKFGGNKRGFASGATRMGMTYSLINQADLDVIGFQEFEEVAVRPVPVPRRLAVGRLPRPLPRPRFDPRLDRLAYRRVEAGRGQQHRDPLLRRRPDPATRDQAREHRVRPRGVVLQHPQPRVDAKGHGNNAHWRGVAVGIQIRLANELGADGTPGRVHRRLQRPGRGVLPDRRRHRAGGRQRRRLLQRLRHP